MEISTKSIPMSLFQDPLEVRVPRLHREEELRGLDTVPASQVPGTEETGTGKTRQQVIRDPTDPQMRSIIKDLKGKGDL